MRMQAQVKMVVNNIKDTELSRDSDLTTIAGEDTSKHQYLKAGSGHYSQLLNYINKRHGNSRVDSSLLTQHISNYSKKVKNLKSHQQISSLNKKVSAQSGEKSKIFKSFDYTRIRNPTFLLNQSRNDQSIQTINVTDRDQMSKLNSEIQT